MHYGKIDHVVRTDSCCCCFVQVYVSGLIGSRHSFHLLYRKSTCSAVYYVEGGLINNEHRRTMNFPGEVLHFPGIPAQQRNLSALLRRTLVVGRRQPFESIEAALDME